MQRLLCLSSSRFLGVAPQAPFVTSIRNKSGYHTLDDKDLSQETAYDQFKKPSVTIGELIGFVNHIADLYPKSPYNMKSTMVKGGEKVIDTVLEYFCNNGRGSDIGDIIKKMPLAGTTQAFLYYTQAYINAGEMKEAESVLELLDEHNVHCKTPFEMILQEYSKKEEWESVVRVMERMEAFGYSPDFSTALKIEKPQHIKE